MSPRTYLGHDYGEEEQRRLDEGYEREARLFRRIEESEYSEPTPEPEPTSRPTNAAFEEEMYWQLREDGPAEHVATIFSPRLGRRIPTGDACWICRAPWDTREGCGRCGMRP